MVEKNSAWRTEPLTWGQGSKVFEVFLEPTCPFSAKAFGKLDETLQSAGAGNVTLKIWLHSQPWHLFSGVITRCALAASTLGEGKGAARTVLEGNKPNDPFAAQYRRWKEAGLTPRNARRNVARSLSAVAWGMWKNGGVYQPARVGMASSE